MTPAGTPARFLVYDGDCGFCANALRALRRVLPDWPETFAWQTLDLAHHGLSPEQVARAAWWIERGRAPAGGARAFAALLVWQRSRGWRVLGRLLSVPPVSWAAEPVYAVVARTRHRLPGGTPLCSVRGDTPRRRAGPAARPAPGDGSRREGRS
ncbi:thiol-disulfide oxidoreductase DCC family protein [Streptosporangium sp. G12]